MIANGNENMADLPKDWEQAEDEGPELDIDLEEYNQFLLENPNLEEELPKEKGTKSIEQPDCYMNL